MSYYKTCVSDTRYVRRKTIVFVNRVYLLSFSFVLCFERVSHWPSFCYKSSLRHHFWVAFPFAHCFATDNWEENSYSIVHRFVTKSHVWVHVPFTQHPSVYYMKLNLEEISVQYIVTKPIINLVGYSFSSFQCVLQLDAIFFMRTLLFDVHAFTLRIIDSWS